MSQIGTACSTVAQNLQSYVYHVGHLGEAPQVDLTLKGIYAGMESLETSADWYGSVCVSACVFCFHILHFGHSDYRSYFKRSCHSSLQLKLQLCKAATVMVWPITSPQTTLVCRLLYHRKFRNCHLHHPHQVLEWTMNAECFIQNCMHTIWHWCNLYPSLYS